MLRVLPIGAVITVQMPMRKELIPIDIVAVNTRRHSCSVEEKHSGRLPIELGSSSAGGGEGLKSRFEIAVSFSAIVLCRNNE